MSLTVKNWGSLSFTLADMVKEDVEKLRESHDEPDAGVLTPYPRQIRVGRDFVFIGQRTGRRTKLFLALVIQLSNPFAKDRASAAP